MKPTFSILLLLFIATIGGCYYDSEERLYPVLSTECDTSTVTFTATIKPILQASCYTCHSNSAVSSGKGNGIKLENHADVKTIAQSGQLMGSVKHEGLFSKMPQDGGKLSVCEISQLQKWVDNQTPNN